MFQWHKFYPSILLEQISVARTTITRKSSCVNARGIPTAAYQVLPRWGTSPLPVGVPPPFRVCPPARSDGGVPEVAYPPIRVPPHPGLGGYPPLGYPPSWLRGVPGVPLLLGYSPLGYPPSWLGGYLGYLPLGYPPSWLRGVPRVPPSGYPPLPGYPRPGLTGGTRGGVAPHQGTPHWGTPILAQRGTQSTPCWGTPHQGTPLIGVPPILAWGGTQGTPCWGTPFLAPGYPGYPPAGYPPLGYPSHPGSGVPGVPLHWGTPLPGLGGTQGTPRQGTPLLPGNPPLGYPPPGVDRQKDRHESKHNLPVVLRTRSVKIGSCSDKHDQIAKRTIFTWESLANFETTSKPFVWQPEVSHATTLVLPSLLPPLPSLHPSRIGTDAPALVSVGSSIFTNKYICKLCLFSVHTKLKYLTKLPK